MAYTPNRAGTASLFGRSGDVGRYLQRLGERVKRTAAGNIHSVSGKLAQSGVTSFSSTPAQAKETVAFVADYALYLHEGTKPHDIGSPVLIQGVGWRYIGRSPSGKGKPHPGTNRDPYLLEALEEEVRRG